MSKLLKADLLASVGGSYDQTRTTIAGRVTQKIVAGKSCLGAPLSNVIDVFTDTIGGGSITPAGPMHLTSAGRLFVVSTITGGIGQIVLYDFDLTGVNAPSYVGMVRFLLPNTAATTHTIRAIKVDDTDTSNIRVFIGSTGSVTINGGLFLINRLVLADFVTTGPATIPFGTGSDQKAVYQINGAGFLGVANNTTAVAGILIDTAGKFVYVHNGVSAAHQYHRYTYSTVPNSIGQTVTTFTIAAPGKVNIVGHGFTTNDPVVFSTTGALPTGITAGTTYFVRNATANDFEVSATSGGASITFTGSASGVATVRRAFGQTSAMGYQATGNLPALTGTLLATNAEDIYTPTSGPNSGFPCAAFGTTTNFYEGRISDLTSAAVTWPTLRTCNLLGSATDIITPTAQFMQIGGTTQDLVYVTANAQFVSKPVANNVIHEVFGSYVNAVLEANPTTTHNFGVNLVAGIERRDGWLLASSTGTGQRVISYMDFRSHKRHDFSYIISPVLSLENATVQDIRTIESIFDLTAPNFFSYRTTGFGSASGGWVPVATAEDLLAAAISSPEIQFKILFDIANQRASTPAQIADLYIDALFAGENSLNWELSQSLTTSGTPTRSAFRLRKTYSGVVPALRYVATDLSAIQLVNETTTEAPSKWQYSTDGGSTWLPLGTIPNIVGTLVRYSWSSPPGVDIRPGLREA